MGTLLLFKEKKDFEKLMALYYDGASQRVDKLLDERYSGRVVGT